MGVGRGAMSAEEGEMMEESANELPAANLSFEQTETESSLSLREPDNMVTRQQQAKAAKESANSIQESTQEIMQPLKFSISDDELFL